MRRLITAVIGLALVGSCAGPTEHRLTERQETPRGVLDVTVLDRTGLVVGLDILVGGRRASDIDRAPVANPDGRPDVLLVTFMTNRCVDPPVEVTISLERHGRRIALAINHHRRNDSCREDVGVDRRVELRLAEPVPAERVDAIEQVVVGSG